MRLFILIFSLFCFADVVAATAVVAQRTPNEGFQSQLFRDERGNIHLVYLKGDASAPDIFYQSLRAGAADFSTPVRVNSEGKAVAIGTIRGPQVAAAGGWVHVVWNGHAPKDGTYLDAPMLYARLAPGAPVFERERNLITTARGLDGGGAVAADPAGNVLVFWHAPQPGDTNGESGRALYVARSRDSGRSFMPEQLATSEKTGACACCGMKAFTDSDGNIFAIFRGATDNTSREEIVLAGRADSLFKPIARDLWKIGMCPMSSASFASSQGGTLVAWESQDHVRMGRISAMILSEPVSPEGKRKRKHPTVAVNRSGEILLAWTEGTAWAKGGSVAWQLYSPDLQTVGAPGRAEGMPTWSLPAAFARPDGSFGIYY